MKRNYYIPYICRIRLSYKRFVMSTNAHFFLSQITLKIMSIRFCNASAILNDIGLCPVSYRGLGEAGRQKAVIHLCVIAIFRTLFRHTRTSFYVRNTILWNNTWYILTVWWYMYWHTKCWKFNSTVDLLHIIKLMSFPINIQFWVSLGK